MRRVGSGGKRGRLVAELGGVERGDGTVYDGKRSVLRTVEVEGVHEGLGPSRGKQALPDGLRREQIEDSTRPLGIEGAENVIEQQERRLIKVVAEKEGGRDSHREAHGAMLPLRSKRAHVETIEPERDLVKVGADERAAHFALSTRHAVPGVMKRRHILFNSRLYRQRPEPLAVPSRQKPLA